MKENQINQIIRTLNRISAELSISNKLKGIELQIAIKTNTQIMDVQLLHEIETITKSIEEVYEKYK